MAMTNTLKFLRTFTLDEFKEWKGILQIRIIRNEQTGKYFFGYGDKAGAVTSKYPAEPLDHPVIAAGKAGAAISYALGQGAPMIAAVWGVFIWKEFKGADRKTNTLLAVMFLFFIAGLASIIASGGN